MKMVPETKIRRAEAVALRRSGLTWEKIGFAMEISGERARQLVINAVLRDGVNRDGLRMRATVFGVTHA